MPVLLTLFGQSLQAEVAVPVRIVAIDGAGLAGQWLGSSSSHGIDVKSDDGIVSIDLDELALISFHEAEVRVLLAPSGNADSSTAERVDSAEDDVSAGESDSATGDPQRESIPILLHLADGGRLRGMLIAASESGDAILTDSVLGSARRFPLDRLAGIQFASGGEFPRAGELFRDALAARKPGHDELVTRSDDKAATVRGRLVKLDARQGSFLFASRTRTFQIRRIFGIALAAGAGAPGHRAAGLVPRPALPGSAGASRHSATVEDYPATIALVDGSVFSGRVAHAGVDSVRVETSLGFAVDLPVADIAQIRIRSDRVVYVSDLPLGEARIEGLVHRPWPLRRDASVSGGPLVMNGREFEKGLGVHSFTSFDVVTSIDVETGGSFERFAVTIGLDDFVRPRGSVVFRVLADGKTLFDSGLVTGMDPPKNIVLDIKNVKVLTLIVDYGEGLDIADHADWGDARLLRPPTRLPSDTS